MEQKHTDIETTTEVVLHGDTGEILNPDLIHFNFAVANFTFSAFRTHFDRHNFFRKNIQEELHFHSIL